MINFRGLAVAFVLLIALGGFYLYERKKPVEARNPPDAAPKILSIPEDQFQQVTLSKGGEKTVLAKESGKWRIAEPKPLPADQDTVNSLVTSLASLNADKLVEEKASDLATYGLATPSAVITIRKKDGKTHKVDLGDETPTSGGVYAKLEGDPRVFTIASYTKSNFEKTSKDLRDKRLLTFDSDKLTRVDLEAKGQSIEFGKNNQNEWQILKPRPLRADGTQVDELVRKLKDAKLDTTGTDEDAKKAAAAFASGARVATATVADANGAQSLELRRKEEKKDKTTEKTYYAKSSVVEGVYKIPNDLGDGLDKGLEDFRNRKLFDFGWNDPTKLDIRNGSAQAAYQKSGDKWMSSGKQMDSSTLQSLIDKLRDLSSVKFIESAGGIPVFEATVISNDGKRTEKVIISKQGNSYTAKRENEPSVYELDGKAVEDLQKAASGVREIQPPKNEKKK